jgi:aryl-alcohol dehydrogenase-like predicted oxidoreductase
MQHRNLGSSGLKVSPLCLGTMMFGGPTDEATATRIAAKAKDQGVNFIDTADGYAGGKSEEVTGRAIGNQRNDWVLATKLGNVRGTWPNHGGLSRKWVMQCCEESLRRLGTDYVDILYLHKEDHETPLAETVRALGALQQQGKIRYFGVSNHRAWRIAEICNLCDRMGIDRPVVNQPYYHALYRVAEVEQLPDAGSRAEIQGACREARHRAEPSGGRVGVEQQAHQRRGRGSAHRGAVGRLRESARRPGHRRGRGLRRRSGGRGSPRGARL